MRTRTVLLGFAALALNGCTSIGMHCSHAVDSPTPQVRIVSPVDRSSVKSGDLAIRIQTKDFKFDYARASVPAGTATSLPGKYGELCQEANAGHVHVYLAPYDSRDMTGTQRFLMPQFFMVREFGMPNTAEFSLKGVPAGNYRLLVELTGHDHTPRIKRHPRDWPSIDVVSITVE